MPEQPFVDHGEGIADAKDVLVSSECCVMLTGPVEVPAVKPVTDTWGFFGHDGMMAGGVVTFRPGATRFISFTAHFSDAELRVESALDCSSWSRCAWNGGAMHDLSSHLRFSSPPGNSDLFYVGYAAASGNILAKHLALTAFRFHGGQKNGSFIAYVSDCPSRCESSGTTYVQHGSPSPIDRFFLHLPPLGAVAIFACGFLLLAALYVRISMPNQYARSPD
ncbi:hypothetical protein [Acidihalobacter aeolianus]|uniref:hypothetical protein n=1 Tax=Acidihalobacter aeolianus TaxID=2792603 RepID=UPI0012E9A49D|nr:hypothetical protein [Acidihalobacter aeolianus]